MICFVYFSGIGKSSAFIKRGSGIVSTMPKLSLKKFYGKGTI